MGWLSLASILFGLLNIVFGVLGYTNKGSMASLIAGGIMGLAIIGGATFAKTNPKIGYTIVAVVSVFILGRFFKPGFMEGQIYPAMILGIASILMLILLVIGHFLTPKPASVEPAAPAD